MIEEDMYPMQLEISRAYSERQVLQEIKVLRGILDRVEKDVKEGNFIDNEVVGGNGIGGLYLTEIDAITEALKECRIAS